MFDVSYNDYFRSLLIKTLNELQQLEGNKELVLSFSHGICQLMQKAGGAVPLLSAAKKCKITREIDPFSFHSG
jgi:hypothetical protein